MGADANLSGVYADIPDAAEVSVFRKASRYRGMLRWGGITADPQDLRTGDKWPECRRLEKGHQGGT